MQSDTRECGHNSACGVDYLDPEDVKTSNSQRGAGRYRDEAAASAVGVLRRRRLGGGWVGFTQRGVSVPPDRGSMYVYPLVGCAFAGPLQPTTTVPR